MYLNKTRLSELANVLKYILGSVCTMQGIRYLLKTDEDTRNIWPRRQRLEVFASISSRLYIELHTREYFDDTTSWLAPFYEDMEKHSKAALETLWDLFFTLRNYNKSLDIDSKFIKYDLQCIGAIL